MTIKSYKLWVDKILKIAWHGGSTEASVKKEVSWNIEETTVESAKLRISGRASGSTEVFLYMNGQDIVRIGWGIIDDMKVKESTNDVIGLLINGNNNFEVRFCKIGLWPFDVSIIFTLELVITYSGEEPEVKPWYEKFAVPLGVGIISTVVGGLVIGKVTGGK